MLLTEPAALDDMAEGPDLSHLTPEERHIIESVMIRHQQEEMREHEIMRRKQDEVEVLEETIRQRNEQHKKAGVELEATCHICLKTKFADGIGHVCNYCSIRCCARCGGKVTLRSNKVIWVCILCRKKQELLSKTGQWINKGMTGSDSAVMRRIEADMSLMDKRPKLERAHSAAEKENQPLTRSGSSLRRQYSQQDAQAKEEELRFYRGEIEGLMRSQGYPQQQPEYRNDSFSSEQSSSMEVSGGKKHRRAAALGKKSGPPPQRSFSSSDDELRSTPECTSCEEHETEKDVYDVRKDKPSVLVTSPGSPDIHGHSQRIRPRHSPNSNVGGRIQVKLWFDSGALQLVVTLVCAAGLIPRSNGQPRNPYAKLFLLPDRSEKSKRRTKTLANTNDPKWNQSFVYSSVRRADLKLRVVEITVWDYVRYGANDFLGEVLIELSVALLENEAEWFHLSAHDEIIAPHTMDIERDLDVVVTPTEHLSPSTTSRLSDSDPSDLDDSRERRVADGASISSVGSSNSPPPDIEMSEKRKSRRDMSPQGRKSMMIQFGTPVAEPHRKIPVNQRSHSAAPTDSPSVHTRSRSKSPHRSLSPPEYSYRRAVLPSHAYVPRFTSRSATATPITSPKKRQLPQIPPHPTHHSTYRDRVSYDVDDRPHTIKQRPRNVQHRGWSRHGVTGLSESDLSQDIRHRSPPDKEHGENCDSDMESVASITSSAFSTQSERPKGSRYSEYGGTVKTPLVGGGEPQNNSKRAPFSRSLSNADVPAEEHGSLSDTALIRQQTGGSRRKTPSGSSPAPKSSSGMGKKSSSTSQLSATGRKRRLGFGTKGKSSFTVHRSEEVVPDDIKHLVKQGSSVSSDGEGSQDGDSWAPSLKGSDGDQLTGFLDGVGPAQLVGRQVLVDPALGEIQLSMCYQKGYLEVEVIRARGLQAKANSKTLPAPYVKVYLVCGKKCLAKAKTTTARRTLDPLYQQQLTFRGPFRNCILQVTVWGDYGRMEGKKVFMGVAQILLDHLNLQNLNIGWYKLYGTSSLVSGPPFLALSRGTSLASLDSLKHSS
nr:regulating synaptic membrane exocytosis protein 2 isoform X4 [Halyomorpha halys]